MAVHIRLAHKEQKMMYQWRDLAVGTWFKTNTMRVDAHGNGVRVVYEIYSIAAGYIGFHATHDHTIRRLETVGWVIDNGYEIF